MDEREVVQKLEREYHRLTKGQQRLAAYVSENPFVLGMVSAQELADAVGVSESTVFRFAQALGYSGYFEMKQDLQKAIMAGPRSSEKLRETISQLEGRGEYLKEFIEGHRQALDFLETSLSSEGLEKAARRIVNADTVYLYGEGSALVPVTEVAFWLRRLGKTVFPISETGRNLFDQIMHITNGDAVVGFAFRRINQELEILFQEAQSRGASTILVTDRSLSDINRYSDEILTIRRGAVGQFRSMAIPVLLGDALLLTVAKLDEPRLQHLQELEELRTKYGFS